jgi:hypothetical protein
MVLKDQYDKRWNELFDHWIDSFIAMALTIDASVSALELMDSEIHLNELWPPDCRLPFLGSDEGVISNNLEKYRIEQEIIKSNYIYIYSKLDGLLESIFMGRFTFSSDFAYSFLRENFKKWKISNRIRSSDNVARYRYLFLVDSQHKEIAKEIILKAELFVLSYLTHFYDKNDGMPDCLIPEKIMNLMMDLKKFNGVNRGLRNRLIHGGLNTDKDIRISRNKIIEVLGQSQRISIAAIWYLFMMRGGYSPKGIG